MRRTTRLAVFTVVLGSLVAVGAAMAKEARPQRTGHPMLEALNRHRPVLRVVTKYYPDATCLLFGKKLHFEDSTQLYVAKAIVKVRVGETPPLVEVRGPKQKSGVWCDIILAKGSSKHNARAEGSIEREHFVEHKLYQDLRSTDYHLDVTLRVPRGDDSGNFVRDFTALIRSYSHDFVTDK